LHLTITHMSTTHIFQLKMRLFCMVLIGVKESPPYLPGLSSDLKGALRLRVTWLHQGIPRTLDISVLRFDLDDQPLVELSSIGFHTRFK